jgi:arginase
VGLVYFDLHADMNTRAGVIDGALDWTGVAHVLALDDTEPAMASAVLPAPLLTADDGLLPIMAEVYEEAARRNVEIVALRTEAACRLLADLGSDEVNAVLHVTC